MDIVMPVIDGIEATKLIRIFEQRHNLRQVPIFIVTSQTDPRVKRAAYQAGANEYFVKPLRRFVLAKCLYTYKANLHSVLIVDQDRFSLDMTKSMLTLEGFKPIHTMHPTDVYAILQEIKIDVILIDQHLDAVGGGDKFVQELRSRKVETPIIISSNNNTQ